MIPAPAPTMGLPSAICFRNPSRMVFLSVGGAMLAEAVLFGQGVELTGCSKWDRSSNEYS